MWAGCDAAKAEAIAYRINEYHLETPFLFKAQLTRKNNHRCIAFYMLTASNGPSATPSVPGGTSYSTQCQRQIQLSISAEAHCLNDVICKSYFQLDSHVRLTSSTAMDFWKLLFHFTGKYFDVFRC